MTTPRKVLIADDDASIRLVLSQAFVRAGFQVRATGAAATLLKWVSDGEGDLVVSDVIMPDENIFELLPRIRKLRPKLPVVIMSAQNTLLTAVSAAETGAFEYIPKPFDLDDMLAIARRALAKPAAAEPVQARARAARDERLPLIGRSAPMQEVYRTLARLVGAELTVLIQGESGTGKELAARALHDLGKRRDGRFVVVHLAATPRERVESELFGRDGETGKLVDADGGTLFLDEIADLPAGVQAALLRFLDDFSVRPVGGTTTRVVDTLLLAATNADLAAAVAAGKFRADLYYRLAITEIHLPRLAERTDFGSIAIRLLAEIAPECRLDEAAIARLQRQDWPGNIRQLRNALSRLSLHGAALIDADAVGVVLPEAAAAPAQSVLRDVQTRQVAAAMRETDGNISEAARRLGVSRNTIYRAMRNL